MGPQPCSYILTKFVSMSTERRRDEIILNDQIGTTDQLRRQRILDGAGRAFFSPKRSDGSNVTNALENRVGHILGLAERIGFDFGGDGR